MDKLKLGIRSNDEIQPDLRELIDLMNRLSILPSNFEGKIKIQNW
jgi:ESCRT-I complex subunit VPS28